MGAQIPGGGRQEEGGGGAGGGGACESLEAAFVGATEWGHGGGGGGGANSDVANGLRDFDPAVDKWVWMDLLSDQDRVEYDDYCRRVLGIVTTVSNGDPTTINMGDLLATLASRFEQEGRLAATAALPRRQQQCRSNRVGRGSRASSFSWQGGRLRPLRDVS